MTRDAISERKQALRARLKAQRRDHVAALPQAVRALVFNRPPSPVAAKIGGAHIVGLYHPSGSEAPTGGYARWLHENGHALALPWFADREGGMVFREWSDPYDEGLLEAGPFGHLQPRAGARLLEPDVLFVPLVGFTAGGDRLGQGGGHYDRWLATHPEVPAIGLAWDSQRIESFPTEPHDRPLRMIVTPTRCYEVGA